VEITTQAIDPSKLDYNSQILFDGQTGEMLAFARIERGQKVGMVFDRQHRVTTRDNAGWDDANAYLEKNDGCGSEDYSGWKTLANHDHKSQAHRAVQILCPPT